MRKYEGHTPGPWKVQDAFNQKSVYSPNHPEGKVCLFHPDDKMALANAKLIADAPMLAERVEILEQELTGITNERDLFAGNAKRARADKKKLAEQNERMLAMLNWAEREARKVGHEFMAEEIEALITEIEEGA